MIGRTLAAIVIALVLLPFLLGAQGRGTAPAAIDPARSSIADSARLAARAADVQLHGVVRCTGCRSFTLGATVSQRGTGALAQGGIRCICHGTAERWSLTARAQAGVRFEPGAARVCVWVAARGAGGRALDARQWCEPVTLRAIEA